MGGGYSQGCATCKRRKVKCDETRPVCLRCTKRGVKCEGWTKRPLKFMNYGTLSALDRRVNEAQVAVSNQFYPPPAGSTPTLQRSQLLHGTRDVDWMRSSPWDSLPVNYENLRVLDLARFARGQSLRQGVTNAVVVEKQSFIPAWPAPNSSYLTYIPARLGRSAVLDDAVSCVVSAFEAFMTDGFPDNQKTTSCYLRALGSLNRALLTIEAYSADTLCAVILLGVYELISGSEASSWIKHAGGASRLMQSRGTKRWTSDFEKSLFQAHLPVMITEAFINNKVCFLEDSAWRSVILECNPPSEIYYASRATFFSVATTRAGLQRDITDFLSNKASQTQRRGFELLLRAKRRASELQDWFDTWSVGVAKKTKALGLSLLDSTFRSQIFGSTVEIADRPDFRAYIGFCNAWSHANFHLLSLEANTEYVTHNFLIAGEVYRAIDYLIQLDGLEISHVDGASETARLTLILMKDWTVECEKRQKCKEPGGRFIDFRYWLQYLHAHRVVTGHNLDCLTA